VKRGAYHILDVDGLGGAGRGGSASGRRPHMSSSTPSAAHHYAALHVVTAAAPIGSNIPHVTRAGTTRQYWW
jgi:hypothetical protein